MWVELKMEKKITFKLMFVVLFLGVFVACGLCVEDTDSDAVVYIVTLKQAPVSHFYGEELRVKGHHHHHSKNHGSGNVSRLDKPSHISHKHAHNASSTSRMHDSLLREVLRREKYLKLYSYRYLINGFVVLVTPQQAFKLANRREVSNVVLDFSVRTATTHTPQFLGLPLGAWAQEDGYETAGKGIVIGFIDNGIDPTHPSFSDNTPERHYPVRHHFSVICEVTRDFLSRSCKRKLVGARHFAASAITRGY